jgi:ATP-dependent Clp protease ATP-binding subunit ClpC
VGSSAIVFEHFTERARQVVVLAQEEARGLHHGYIGEEHILLGLLREDEGLAARVLESLNMTVERVRDEVVLLEGRGEAVDSGMIPFTARAKEVLESGPREARRLGQDQVGTEHLLLGLLREDDGVVAQVFRDFATETQTVRAEVLRMLPPTR